MTQDQWVQHFDWCCDKGCPGRAYTPDRHAEDSCPHTCSCAEERARFDALYRQPTSHPTTGATR